MPLLLEKEESSGTVQQGTIFSAWFSESRHNRKHQEPLLQLQGISMESFPSGLSSICLLCHLSLILTGTNSVWEVWGKRHHQVQLVGGWLSVPLDNTALWFAVEMQKEITYCQWCCLLPEFIVSPCYPVSWLLFSNLFPLAVSFI